MYAEVAVAVGLRQTFTYRLPGEMSRHAGVGRRVAVPLGKQMATGFIVALHELKPEGIDENDIKEVEELIDEEPVVSSEMLELTRWMADYYYASWGECLKAALPAGAADSAEKLITITEPGVSALTNPNEKKLTASQKQALEAISRRGSAEAGEIEQTLSHLKPATVAALIRELEKLSFVRVIRRAGESRLVPKLQNAVRLSEAWTMRRGEFEEGPFANRRPDGAGSSELSLARENASGKPPGKGLSEQQRKVIDELSSGEESIALGELLTRTDVSASVVRTLEKRGVVEVFAREVRRDPLAHLPRASEDSVTLTADQKNAVDQLVAGVESKTYSAFLLHGVTGSGKTEIYVRAMREAVDLGRTALMLAPEISLTPMFSRRLRAQFGDQLAVLHSSLSDGERRDEWRRIKEGEARVVLGTRSAVFAPLDNLGVIVVDEEHDSSYKQEENPRYSGRDTAIVRAARAGAVAVLGSATPSIESFHNARSGKYKYIRLGSRIGGRPLANVETVDMRDVFKRHGKQQTFSDELKAAIEETFARGEQIMILLNRRGFSSFLLCRSCGLSIHCVNCDVTLTYHKYNTSLQCHYCNYISAAPDRCPACGGQYIHYAGEGTEQLEERLKEMYPAMRIARLDRDTTRRRGGYEHILMEFHSGGTDLLVGTQMIAKGHDFPNVTLVGVVSVDVGLSLPDFRSAERTFQLLTQVAGRAGRGDRPGRVIIQTYHPSHYALMAAKSQDYEQFYNREIEFRRSMHYPPFTALINIGVRDKDRQRAADTASDFARDLRAAARALNVRVLGPAPAAIPRLKGEYRFQVLIKAGSRAQAREALDAATARAASAGRKPRTISVEVDPLNLM